MTKDDTYNGFVNWATWNVALWLDNDTQERYYFWQRAAKRALVDAAFDHDKAVRLMMSRLKYEHMDPDSFQRNDLDPEDWSQVYWPEIAEHMIDEQIEELAHQAAVELDDNQR
jgi:ClpP class serine protease